MLDCFLSLNKQYFFFVTNFNRHNITGICILLIFGSITLRSSSKVKKGIHHLPSIIKTMAYNKYLLICSIDFFKKAFNFKGF